MEYTDDDYLLVIGRLAMEKAVLERIVGLQEKKIQELQEGRDKNVSDTP